MSTSSNPLAGRRFVDEDGNPVVPGEELGAGGGGAVYDVKGQPDDVVKIWHEENNTGGRRRQNPAHG